jgi:hypothetical protein
MVMSAEAVCAAEGSKMSTCTITSGKNASGEQAICGMLGQERARKDGKLEERVVKE